MDHTHSRGSLVVELLIATFMFSSILAIGTSLLVNQINSHKNQASRQSSIRHIWIASEAIQRANQSSNQYWGSINMFITPNGSFLTRDGHPLHIEMSNTDLTPAVNSQILTFREVIPTSRLEVTSSQRTSHGLTLSLCGSVDITGGASLGDMNSWLALTVDGNFPLAGSIRETSAPARHCNEQSYNAILRYPTNPPFPGECYFCDENDIVLEKKPIVILGVKSVFSLYVDHLGRLRMLSHTDRSNQPIVSGIKNLSITTLAQDTSYRLKIGTTSLTERRSYEIILNNKHDPRVGLEMLP